MKHLKYFESNDENKRKFCFIFIIDRNWHRDKWIDALKTFRSLDVDWWVKPQNASHLGLHQKYIKYIRYRRAKKISEYIESKFDEAILICLSKQSISKHEPVGESTDKGWWNIGKEFDKMVSNGTKGIYII
jgi:hypothetical protein